ncbi:HAD hydrolase-like protein [Candidatus Bipolaricaulota bacterium]|nr:HAD hydrolase-like protein [Candidatus Bipolaricaulota bacterium]
MMIPRLCPTETVETIFDIDFEKLHTLGKQALLFDFDNTLAEKGSPTMPSVSNALLEDLATIGFRIGILTNRRRRRMIADVLFPIIYHACKPRRAGYLAMLETLSSSPEHGVMIGNRYITDVMGGNRLGIYTMRVRRYPFDNNRNQPNSD